MQLMRYVVVQIPGATDRAAEEMRGGWGVITFSIATSICDKYSVGLSVRPIDALQ